MCPRGVVGVRVLDMSSGAPLLDLRSCCGEGLGESEGGLLEGRARVADGNGHELYLAPHFPEGVDEWGVLGGLLLKPLVTTELLAETYLDDDEIAILPIEGGWVRFGVVRDSSGVDEVGSCTMARREEGVLGLEGEDPFRDAGWCCCAVHVAASIDRCVSQVQRDVCMSVVPGGIGDWGKGLEPVHRRGVWVKS